MLSSGRSGRGFSGFMRSNTQKFAFGSCKGAVVMRPYTWRLWSSRCGSQAGCLQRFDGSPFEARGPKGRAFFVWFVVRS